VNIVPGLGRHLFSVAAASKMGAVTSFDSTTEMGSITLPLKRLGGDELLYSFSLDLRGETTGTAMRAESVNPWHWRLGHVCNATRSSHALQRQTQESGCLGEGGQQRRQLRRGQSHPKEATYNVPRPFQLVYTDLMGPITPPALGGYNYVSKFTDQVTKWKEIFPIKDKSDSIDYLKSLVVSSELRVKRLRTAGGRECTSDALKDYCLQTVIRHEFALTNAPQQIDACERDGRILARMVHCLL
ncbi:unnamed protein product, partial [Sphacelaria rigidula]